jgi:hypothetical protein
VPERGATQKEVSFKLNKEPVVQPDKAKQLEFLIDAAKLTQSPKDLLDYVIKLYGDEFIKANDEIARLRSANDQLFLIKQKVVIVNRELMQKNKDCEAKILELQGEVTRLLAEIAKHS